MANNIYICGGCGNKFKENDTAFYRKKRWCGSVKCKNVIDAKVKNANYKAQMKKRKKGKYRKGVDIELKNLILQRDNRRCAMCSIGSPAKLQVHHIVPIANSGTDEHNNLLTLCNNCHLLVHKEGWEKYEAYFKSHTSSLEEVKVI